MPNGRSDEFGVNKESLERSLSALPSEAVVGRSATSGDVNVSAVARMVSEYPDDLIRVEEQDHRWYIIHLESFQGNPPSGEKLIMILPESPLFEELRRQYDRHGK